VTDSAGGVELGAPAVLHHFVLTGPQTPMFRRSWQRASPCHASVPVKAVESDGEQDTAPHESVRAQWHCCRADVRPASTELAPLIPSSALLAFEKTSKKGCALVAGDGCPWPCDSSSLPWSSPSFEATQDRPPRDNGQFLASHCLAPAPKISSWASDCSASGSCTAACGDLPEVINPLHPQDVPPQRRRTCC
jgi:hypothetical protein